jgi:hypothetical protein
MFPAGAEEAAARKVLFFDLWKLDAWNNIELRQGEPEWVEECEYRDPSFPERGVYFPSVWIDEESGRFRMVHSVKWSPFTMMAAESEDGVSWAPLDAPDVNPGGEKLAPNHLFTFDGSGGGVYVDPRKTDGYRYRIFGRQHGNAVFERALADPNHRWHEAAKREGEKRYFGEGCVLVSRDGLQWELKTGGKWDWTEEDWLPEPPTFAFWNESHEEHVLVVRPGWGDRRQCLRTTSDFATWGEPELQFQPDPLDTAGPVGMYGMPVRPVGNGAGYVGLLWIFHNSSSEPVNSYNQFFGTMDCQLAYSYDGVRFFRGLREPFLELNPIPKPGCVQIRPCSIVETDDAILIYSEGHKGAHGRERSQQRQTEEPLGSLMIHRLRKDGWMCLASLGDWARFQTKPFTIFDGGIRVNANARYGEIRFQLTDEKSDPIEGFTFEECLPLRGEDSLDFPVRWKEAKLEDVANQVLRLEVKFRQANLYSLAMKHHFLDAQDQWLLKDGKSIPTKRFDF